MHDDFFFFLGLCILYCTVLGTANHPLLLLYVCFSEAILHFSSSHIKTQPPTLSLFTLYNVTLTTLQLILQLSPLIYFPIYFFFVLAVLPLHIILSHSTCYNVINLFHLSHTHHPFLLYHHHTSLSPCPALPHNATVICSYPLLSHPHNIWVT